MKSLSITSIYHKEKLAAALEYKGQDRDIHDPPSGTYITILSAG